MFNWLYLLLNSNWHSWLICTFETCFLDLYSTCRHVHCKWPRTAGNAIHTLTQPKALRCLHGVPSPTTIECGWKGCSTRKLHGKQSHPGCGLLCDSHHNIKVGFCAVINAQAYLKYYRTFPYFTTSTWTCTRAIRSSTSSWNYWAPHCTTHSWACTGIRGSTSGWNF